MLGPLTSICHPRRTIAQLRFTRQVDLRTVTSFCLFVFCKWFVGALSLGVGAVEFVSNPPSDVIAEGWSQIHRAAARSATRLSAESLQPDHTHARTRPSRTSIS